MSKLYKEMDETEKEQCQEKIDWLATIGFELLPDQPTPRLIHKDLQGEIYDVYDLNPLVLVKKIYDLGEETVNRIIDDNKER